MPGKKEPSIYDLFKGRLVFTDEPLWFRILLYLITALFVVAMIWALHEWALPTLAAKTFSPKIMEFLKIGKGRSP